MHELMHELMHVMASHSSTRSTSWRRPALWELRHVACQDIRVSPPGRCRRRTDFSMGRSSALPSTGMRRRKESTVGKKPAKSSQKPYASTAMPTIAQPHTTSARPPRKKAEPCAGGGAVLLGARPTEEREGAQQSHASAVLGEAAAGTRN